MADDPKPADALRAAREAKLAQALRANLRRRKVAGRPAPPKNSGPDEASSN